MSEAFKKWWDKQDIPSERLHNVEIETVKHNTNLAWKAGYRSALNWVMEISDCRDCEYLIVKELKGD